MSDCEADEKRYISDIQRIRDKHSELERDEAKYQREYKETENQLQEKRGSFQNQGGYESDILKNLLSAQERGHVSGVIVSIFSLFCFFRFVVGFCLFIFFYYSYFFVRVFFVPWLVYMISLLFIVVILLSKNT